MVVHRQTDMDLLLIIKGWGYRDRDSDDYPCPYLSCVFWGIKFGEASDDDVNAVAILISDHMTSTVVVSQGATQKQGKLQNFIIVYLAVSKLKGTRGCSVSSVWIKEDENSQILVIENEEVIVACVLL